MKYWLYSDGNILGPYEPAELLAAPDFTEESLICDEDSINASRDDWKPASQFPEFSKIIEAAAAGAASADEVSEKGTGGTDSTAQQTEESVLSQSPSEEKTEPLIQEIKPVSDEFGSADISAIPEKEPSGLQFEPPFPETDEPSSSSENKEAPAGNAGAGMSEFEKSISDFNFDSVSVSPFGLDAEKEKMPFAEKKTDNEPETTESGTFSQEVEAELVSPVSEPAEYDFPPGYKEIKAASEVQGLSGIKESAGISSSEKTGSAAGGNEEEKKVSGPVSMLDFLASLENILGEDKKATAGADKPPEGISDFQKEVSKELGEEKKERNVKEELDSVRLEKDLLLGQISLQEMNEGNIRQRISELIQTFKSNAHRQGGKSVFDDDPNPLPPPEEMSRKKLPVKNITEEGRLPQETDDGGNTNFADGFISGSGPEPIETEIDDSYAETIKSSAEGRKRKSSASAPYDVSNDSQGRPPIYFYELKKETEPERRESVTKVSLSDDFRSGLIDFEPDEEDQTLHLLPQQAGGIIYDFTTLSGKKVKTSASRKRSSSAAAVIDIDVSEKNSAETEAAASDKEKSDSSVKKIAGASAAAYLYEKSKQDKTEEEASQKKQKDGRISENKLKSSKRSGPITLGNSGRSVSPRSLDEKEEKAEQAPAMSGIRSSRLSSRSKEDKKNDELRKTVSAEDEGPLLEEVNSGSSSADTVETQISADSELASMDDEDRLLRETYEAIMAGKDPAMLSSTRAKKEDMPGTDVWEAMFDSGNLLQAASIESIGKDSQTDSFADDANPFKAADIYSTPQQNVQADSFPQDSFASENMADSGTGAGTDFLNIAPVMPSSAGPVEIQNDFSDYYVNNVPQQTETQPVPADEMQETGAYGTTEDEAIPENLPQEEQVQPEEIPQQEEVPVSEEKPETEPAEEPQPAVTEISAPQPEEEKEEPEHITPKVIKSIPASISSIHRSIEPGGDKDIGNSDIEQIPDFNVQLASLESSRTKGPAVSALSSNRDGESSHRQADDVLDIKPAASRKEEDLPPALELAGMHVASDSSSVLPQFEINTSKLRKKEEAENPAVNYYSPNDKQQDVKATVALPVEPAPVQYVQPENRHSEPAHGTLSTVLNSRVKNDEPPVFNAGQQIPGSEPSRGRSNKLLFVAMGMIIVLLCGVILLFMLGGSGNGGKNIARGSSAPAQVQEQQPEQQAETPQHIEEQPETQPEQHEAQNQQPEPAGQAQNDSAAPAQEEPAQPMEPVKVAPPVTATDKLEKAVEIVKNYRLSGGRGTISSWFSNSFLASSANSEAYKWTATPLHADVYVVEYRLPRSRQDPLIYQFEVDVEQNKLMRGINNNAIDLLDTNSSKTARAVPARNTYESETAVRTEVRTISRTSEPSAKESIIQKAKKKLATKKKKTNEIKQLPLPPAPKKRYSQSVPTGFEQPEEDPDEAFLKAMESDEELF